jgi:hypothetical protein
MGAAPERSRQHDVQLCHIAQRSSIRPNHKQLFAYLDGTRHNTAVRKQTSLCSTGLCTVFGTNKCTNQCANYSCTIRRTIGNANICANTSRVRVRRVADRISPSSRDTQCYTGLRNSVHPQHSALDGLVQRHDWRCEHEARR